MNMKTTNKYQTPYMEVLEIVATATLMEISATGTGVKGVKDDGEIKDPVQIL